MNYQNEENKYSDVVFNKTAYEKCKSVLENHKVLHISGMPHTGKKFLANHLCKNVLKQDPIILDLGANHAYSSLVDALNSGNTFFINNELKAITGSDYESPVLILIDSNDQLTQLDLDKDMGIRCIILKSKISIGQSIPNEVTLRSVSFKDFVDAITLITNDDQFSHNEIYNKFAMLRNSFNIRFPNTLLQIIKDLPDTTAIDTADTTRSSVNREKMQTILKDSKSLNKLKYFFNLYVKIGGLPEVFVAYLNGASDSELLRIQTEIYNEIAKFDDQKCTDIIQTLKEQIGSRKKFTFKKLGPQARFHNHKDAIEKLINLGIVIPSYQNVMLKPILPDTLKNIFNTPGEYGEFKNNAIKLYFADPAFYNAVKGSILGEEDGRIENALANVLYNTYGFLSFLNEKNQTPIDFIIAFKDDFSNKYISTCLTYDRDGSRARKYKYKKDMVNNGLSTVEYILGNPAVLGDANSPTNQIPWFFAAYLDVIV